MELGHWSCLIYTYLVLDLKNWHLELVGFRNLQDGRSVGWWKGRILGTGAVFSSGQWSWCKGDQWKENDVWIWDLFARFHVVMDQFHLSSLYQCHLKLRNVGCIKSQRGVVVSKLLPDSIKLGYPWFQPCRELYCNAADVVSIWEHLIWQTSCLLSLLVLCIRFQI